jgi:hypothetical protein
MYRKTFGSDKSYNQAVCFIAEGQEGTEPGAALQAQHWLQNNRTQVGPLSELVRAWHDGSAVLN